MEKIYFINCRYCGHRDRITYYSHSKKYTCSRSGCDSKAEVKAYEKVDYYKGTEDEHPIQDDSAGNRFWDFAD